MKFNSLIVCSYDKKAFQSNANHPLSDIPYFIANKSDVSGGGALHNKVQVEHFEHVWGAGTGHSSERCSQDWGPVQRRFGPGSCTEGRPGPGSCIGIFCEKNDRQTRLKTLPFCIFVGGWWKMSSQNCLWCTQNHSRTVATTGFTKLDTSTSQYKNKLTSSSVSLQPTAPVLSSSWCIFVAPTITDVTGGVCRSHRMETWAIVLSVVNGSCYWM